MPLHDVIELLAAQTSIIALAAAIHEAGERPANLRIAPLMGAARSPVVATLAHGTTATAGLPCIVYIVSNGDAALRAAEDLRQWLLPEQVLLYPASDAMPYEHMSPGSDVLGQRLKVLQRFAEERRNTRDNERSVREDVALSRVDHQPLIVVVPVKALLQPTLTPRELAAATTELRRGQELSQDELIRHWIAQGYRVGPTVEEPGELNRRGGIVDIWPMGDDRPLRIEWFGDEIDSIRRFDAASQRSEQRIASATIGPPHEIPFWRRADAMERLEAVDVSGMRLEARDQWLASMARLEEGERFEGRAFFAPFFREETKDERRKTEASSDELPSSFVFRPSSLLAHLPRTAVVFFNERALLAQTAIELEHQAEEQRAALTLAGELPAAFPRPYLYWADALAAAQVPLVDLSNNDRGDENREPRDSEDQSLSTQSHSDGSEFSESRGSQFSLPDDLFLPTDLFGGQLRRLVADIIARLRAGERVAIVTPQAARINELVEEAWTEGRRQKTEGSLLEQAELAEDYLRTGAGRRQKAEGSQAEDHDDPSSFSLHPSAFSPIHGTLDAGWRSSEIGLTLYTDSEIFGIRQRRPVAERRRQKEKTATERAAFLRGLKIGDYVVHIEHGIAVYDGLIRRTLDKVEREYLVLRYANNDKLYVPVDQVDRVSRYIGAGDTEPQLTRLGTQEWERAKRKVRQAVRDLANELLAIYAARQLSEGFAFSPDNEWQRELENAFPYVETPDQLRALEEVKHDMEAQQPMDRLLCGDVGFGKTEVALRAAFKAVQDGKQVAILVPTTVLAQQHYDTFRQRMEAFPVTVEMLSRFRSAKEQDEILRLLAKGTIDIVIGTHRLLSKDVHFKDLGLVVVDEEQRFGVRHKERLKQLRAQVDVLTLTATPIPRTLHMSLAGIRDLSVIDTPPEDRLPIKTYVLASDDNLIREAIQREMERGGQVYFVHNRVHSIYHVGTYLQKLVPEATIGVGHGQLDERQLEKVMFEYFAGKYDVLVCTTIIESGLDVPNANTIIIDNATNYGLAQLYQLRGRVGRSANRAYAYLLYKPDRSITEEAQQRLEAIQEATELGAGFRIAMRDLEIRGAGNLLGPEQSGHIAAVGFDLYSRLLEQAVKDLKAQFDQQQGAKSENREPRTDDVPRDEAGSQFSVLGSKPLPLNVDEKILVNPLVTLDLPLTAFLPPEYIPDDAVRLSVYQRMGEAQTPAEVRALRQELRDRFGALPEPAEQLLTWLMIKSLALEAGVSSVLTTGEEFVVRLPNQGKQGGREKLRRRFGRDAAVRIGPQFVRLDRRSLNGNWVEKLESVLEVLGRD